jgi:peptidoglycan/xylan/chitin deacetylase (PgdA/CDA1 family)
MFRGNVQRRTTRTKPSSQGGAAGQPPGVVVLGYRIPGLLAFAIAAKLIAILLWCCTAQRLAAAIAFFGPDPFVLYALFVPSAQGLCRTYTHFATDRSAVWLTIDDGPDEHDTPRILDLLDRHQARATFFVIGEHAARHPDLVREMVRRGHTIGHHTHTHPAGTFWCASPRRLARELDAALTALGEAGVRPRWFRPPVGIKHLLLEPAITRRDLRCVGWTARSGDCHSDRPEDIVTALEPRLAPGSILLLHEGPSVRPAVRVRGISLLLDTLSARGLTCEIPNESQLRSAYRAG